MPKSILLVDYLPVTLRYMPMTEDDLPNVADRDSKLLRYVLMRQAATLNKNNDSSIAPFVIGSCHWAPSS